MAPSSSRGPTTAPDEGRAAGPVAIDSGEELDSVSSLVDELLLPTAVDDGFVIALADATGRIRHIGGDTHVRSRIEEIGFAVGENWSQSRMGTNAPGTSLLRGTALSVRREEHTRPEVHAFSCSAAPLVHPATGEILGTLDVTGGDVAADPHCLALVRATASAAARELGLRRLADTRAPGNPARPASSVLRLVHRGRPVLETASGQASLSVRHAEILTLLATSPEGLTAAAIAATVYPETAAESTVRVEMLRLRRVLEKVAGAPRLATRPYRLTEPLDIDALQVVEHVGRGDFSGALDLYRGDGIGAAEAAGLSRVQRAAAATLREAMLADADAGTLLRYLDLPEVEHDREPWEVALQILPARAPQRSVVVAHLEELAAAERMGTEKAGPGAGANSSNVLVT
ncbi:GAF domain-containing protein [Dietzia sp.]|uniref:GAF domain-containing protein n=1 Tax=Dietzia sp. TaxID=1871616 RepID=UPI002FD9DE62